MYSASRTATSTPIASQRDSQEQHVITLEWTVGNLKHIFESSKGENKSKCYRSPTFGGNKWQILFYANSGGNDGCISLYLSAEPTAEERAHGTSTTKRSSTFGSHSDLISLPPAASSSKDLPAVAAAGAAGSDVKQASWIRQGSYRFTFELRNLDRSLIKAMDAIDYQFSSQYSNWGYSTFCSRNMSYLANPKSRADDALQIIVSVTEPATLPRSTGLTLANSAMIPLELVAAYSSLFDSPDHSDVVFVVSSSTGRPRRLYAIKKILAMRSTYFETMFQGDWAESLDVESAPDIVSSEDEELSLSDDGEWSEFASDDEDEDEAEQRPQADEQPPATPCHSPHSSTSTPFCSPQPLSSAMPIRASTGSKHMERSVVHITDASYSTFRGALYWLYTDHIQFSALSSTYHAARLNGEAEALQSSRQSWTAQKAGEEEPKSAFRSIAPLVHRMDSSEDRQWLTNAKSIYRLADKMGLSELKSRAATHIKDSVSPQTVPFELFSPFACQFTEIQSHERQFLLAHWTEVRSTESMRQVLRSVLTSAGKHRYPGFAEVWADLLGHLEVVGA